MIWVLAGTRWRGEEIMAEKKKMSESKAQWRWYAITFALTPMLMLIACLYLRRAGWIGLDLTVVALLFAGYWLAVIAVAAKWLRSKERLKQSALASPLIELHLNSDLRAKLVAFAAAQQQKPTVAVFELLDREIPRFEQEDDRHRARHDNEQLRQHAGHGTLLVAVTTEILKRLLLLSGAGDEDRRLWRSYVSETALRIMRDALDHKVQPAE
jgi:hypothetical protein